MNKKGQTTLVELFVILGVLAAVATGVYIYGEHKYKQGYQSAFNQALKEPTYTVSNGGKVTVEAQCKGVGIHLFKGVLGWSW